MLACSDEDVSISKFQTNHLDDFNAFPSPDEECRFKPTSGIVCWPGSSQALAAGNNLNIDILDCLASVRHASFPFSGSENAVVFPATGDPNPRFSHHLPQGLSAPPQRCYPDTGLHDSAKTAAFRDADSAAICESESHMELKPLRSASAI